MTTATLGREELLALAEYHEAGCNRYQGNVAGCTVRRCLVRAGWKIGAPVDYSRATCEAHETAVALRLAPAEQAVREATIEECAKILDGCAQDWNRIRDPGMANNARAYARKIRSLTTTEPSRS